MAMDLVMKNLFSSGHNTTTLEEEIEGILHGKFEMKRKAYPDDIPSRVFKTNRKRTMSR